MRTPRAGRAGFTLMELLVAISLIAILAALLLPVLLQAREAARRTTCASHLRQLGMAFLAYSQDYDELLPGAWEGGPLGVGGTSGTGGWIFYRNFLGPARFEPALGAIYPYVRHDGIYRCPSDPTRYGNSYAMNGLLTAPGPIPGFRPGLPLFAIREPSRTLLLVEESAGVPDDTTDDGFLNPTMNPVTARHGGGANHLHADGHVKSTRREAIRYPNPNGDHRYEP